MITKQACELCDFVYESQDDAETCEREHEAAHDEWCDCSTCRAERCMPEEMSHD